MTRTMGEGAEGSGHDAVCLRSIRTVVDVFGGKWGLLVVEQLHSGTMRFNELARVLGIGTKSLTDTLRHLEECGIVSRAVKSTVPVTVEYSLTEKGRDFDDVLLAMKAWCERWPAEAEGAVTVRRADGSDLGTIMPIIDAARAEIASKGYPQWKNGYPSERDISTDIAEGTARVAEHAGRIVGYMRVGVGAEAYQSDPGLSWAGSAPSTMHRMAVDTGSQGHHVGAAMMRAWEEEALSRGCDSLRAETVDANVPMTGMLLKSGFLVAGHAVTEDARATMYEKMLRRCAGWDGGAAGGI